MDPVHLDDEECVPLVPLRHHLLVRRTADVSAGVALVDVPGRDRPVAGQAICLEAFALCLQGKAFFGLVLGRYSSVDRDADRAHPSRPAEGRSN